MRFPTCKTLFSHLTSSQGTDPVRCSGSSARRGSLVPNTAAALGDEQFVFGLAGDRHQVVLVG